MVGVDIVGGPMQNPEARLHLVVSALMVSALQATVERLVPKGTPDRVGKLKALTDDLLVTVKNQPIAGFDPVVEKVAVERAVQLVQAAMDSVRIAGGE